MAISAAVFVLILLTFEGLLRLTFKTHEPSEGSCAIYSDVLLWSTRPHCNGSNSRGYRDREHTLSKPQGVFRIVIIGDSVAHGHLIDKLEDTFGKVLEHRLNDGGAGRRFETIVLARNGYTTRQQLILLEREALEYTPDLILWSYTLNDPLNPVYHPISFNEPRYGYHSRWHRPKSHVATFVQKKLFFVYEKWKGRDCSSEYHRFLHCTYRDEIREDLQRIGRISTRSRTPVLFAITPVFHRGAYRRYALSELHGQIAAWATEAGLIARDMLEAFRSRDVEDLGFCKPRGCDIWHPSVEGHRVMADYLYGQITAWIASQQPDTRSSPWKHAARGSAGEATITQDVRLDF